MATARTSSETFDALIECASWFLVVSSSGETDKANAEKLNQLAIDCMIKAARSPFFGGTKRQCHTTVLPSCAKKYSGASGMNLSGEAIPFENLRIGH